jgi:hypothetical protein
MSRKAHEQRQLQADAEITRRLEDTSRLPKVHCGKWEVLDFSGLELKADHVNRPLWVTPTGHIFLEARSPLYDEARDFLVAIAEPLRRPDLIHEYRLDKEILFAAASMNMSGESILATLKKFSKFPLAPSVVDFFVLGP